jgi:hypothetical protein
MKTIALLLLLGTLSVEAQTNTPPVATNGVVSTSFLSDVLTFFKEGTNFIVVPYGIVTSGSNNKYDGGGGIALGYFVSQYFVPGMRVEYLNKAFYQASFTSQLEIPIVLAGKFTVVPFAIGGAAVPFGGSANDPGSVQGIAGAGLAVRISSKWDLLADIEKWSATPGQQYRFGVGYKF